jgi:hypothetical protein
MRRLLRHQTGRFLGNKGFVGNWLVGVILAWRLTDLGGVIQNLDQQLPERFLVGHLLRGQ